MYYSKEAFFTGKRVLWTVLAFASLGAAVLLVRGKYGDCDGCGQREKLYRFQVENGDVLWLCGDCLRTAKVINFTGLRPKSGKGEEHGKSEEHGKGEEHGESEESGNSEN